MAQAAAKRLELLSWVVAEGEGVGLFVGVAATVGCLLFLAVGDGAVGEGLTVTSVAVATSSSRCADGSNSATVGDGAVAVTTTVVAVAAGSVAAVFSRSSARVDRLAGARFSVTAEEADCLGVLQAASSKIKKTTRSSFGSCLRMISSFMILNL